jgi:predicted dehydrogenase
LKNRALLEKNLRVKANVKSVVRLGVVGYGFIAQKHIQAYQRVAHPRVVLSAVCDRNAEVEKLVKAKFGSARFYSDLDAMLESEALDLIHISTPPLTHEPLSVKCMEKGYSVVVEKPMATDVEGADRMIKVMRETGVRLYVLHTSLFNPAFLRLTSIISRGEIGKVFGVDVNYFGSSEEYFIVNPNHWSHKLPGGAFCESLPHPLYLLHSILPELEVQSVFAQKIGPLKHVKIDDLCVLLKGDGVSATLRMGWISPRNMGILRVYGTKAILDCDIHGLTVTKHGRALASPLTVGSDNIRSSFSLFKDTIFGFFKWMGGWHGGYQAFIPKIVQNLAGNGSSPVSVEDGREVVRLIEGIYSRFE